MSRDSVEGVIVMAQESRFQLVDDSGVAHLFILSHSAPTEPWHLIELRRSRSRVAVRYGDAPGLMARVAHRIDRAPTAAETG